jgi:hypothetical protein
VQLGMIGHIRLAEHLERDLRLPADAVAPIEDTRVGELR